MTIQLPEEVEKRVIAEAARQGVTPSEYATRLLKETLPPVSESPEQSRPKPRNSLEELFAKWHEEDPAQGPEDIAERNRELEELKEAMNRNRLEMEGPNSRKLFP